MKTLVIVPTYNEIENVQSLVPAILAVNPQVHILIVDDSSPDGTAQKVEQMQKEFPQLHLLLRKAKNGLGKAYLAGFSWGLERGYDILAEMDADFSHRPVDLKKILATLGNHDFVVGSRWVADGGTVHWGWGRRIISIGGSFYARTILCYPLRDWTGGFNCWKAATLRGIELERVESNGYSFQIELKYRALRKGFSGVEVPILFEDRRVGESKMSTQIVLEALLKVWRIKFIV
jgi:dolichol-phosphate mannosyltransferase